MAIRVAERVNVEIRFIYSAVVGMFYFCLFCSTLFSFLLTLHSIQVIFVGDSTCARTSQHFYARYAPKCVQKSERQFNKDPIVSANPHMPSIEYYRTNSTYIGLQVSMRDCAGCQSFHVECLNDSNIEYFAMEFVLDTEIITRRHYFDGTCKAHALAFTPCFQSFTTQEFFYGEYWNNRDCPDIIFHMATAVHDLARRTIDEYRVAVRWMFAVIDLFLRNKCPQTKYYWLPAAKIEQDFVPSDFRSFTKNNMIVRLNEISIAALPRENRNIMLGFNQWQYTENFDVTQYQDAVHLVDAHYSHIAGQLIEAIKVQLPGS